MKSRNRPKIDKNQSLDHKTSFLVLPGFPGSSHGHPGCKSGGTSLPNVRFRAPKATVSVSKITIMRKTSGSETNIQKPANKSKNQQQRQQQNINDDNNNNNNNNNNNRRIYTDILANSSLPASPAQPSQHNQHPLSGGRRQGA